MRLLLVEDDQNLSDAIAEQLQKEGYITDCCYDGETALHYALNPEYGYDIVLLDRMLPIIDGLTVLKAMRQKQIFTPVLILTFSTGVALFLNQPIVGYFITNLLESAGILYFIKHVRKTFQYFNDISQFPSFISLL